jgi:hypothetical protein
MKRWHKKALSILVLHESFIADTQEHKNEYQLEEGIYFFDKIGTEKTCIITEPYEYTLSANVIFS